MGLTSNYVSWADYSACFNPDNRSFVLGVKNNKKALSLFRITDILVGGKSIGDTKIFKNHTTDYISWHKDGTHKELTVKFSKGNELVKSLSIKFMVSYAGIDVVVNSSADCEVVFEADVLFGKAEDVLPMHIDTKTSVVNCASGPAVSKKDDMFFNRQKDTALKFEGCVKPRLKFDWKRNKYAVKYIFEPKKSKKKTRVTFVENVVANHYNIEYSPMSKKRALTKPAVGWMTWYSVKFNACEEKVLKNAKWMSENLKEYGANCIWVDWEWCHKDFTGKRDDDVDFFTPDKEKYPNGLKYVSDKIKEMGLDPALWIGFTVESRMTDFLKENPEIILCDNPIWCGRYFLDFTNPKYINELLPNALKCADNWGYDIIKYDTLPTSMTHHDRFHEKMYDPSITTREAYRKMVNKTREVLGEKRYLLSCSGTNGDSMVLWSAELFDAVRAGEDIFKWEDFMNAGVDRILRFYPLHNNMVHLDCDNVVMREEFNNEIQAASRIYFVSMLGLPVTIGDEFDALDDKRIELIKQCIPVLDVHTKNACTMKRPSGVLKINLAIEREWERYNVVNVFNTEESKTQCTVDISKDLDLESGKYLVFNYTDNTFVGICEDSFDVKLKASESKIFAVRKLTDIPQIVSTSRHISQGALEIENVNYSDNTLSISAELISNVPYTITLYIPDGFKPEKDMVKVKKNIYTKTVTSKKGGKTQIECHFN